MIRRPALTLALLGTLVPGATAQAQVLDLAFVPPDVTPQDLCVANGVETPVVEDEGQGELDPNAEIYLRFLRRDIRDLSAEDADRWFDFILTLIDWQAELDPDFSDSSHLLARIALHVDAGRLDELRASGLIDLLRSGTYQLNSSEKMTLAQYYLNGIGVAPDLEFGQGLVRDAAFGGHVDALMAIARMEVRGTPMPGWDAPLDLTVTLAFGGMLGQMNDGVCRRAERIARTYLDGDVVVRNTGLAYSWYKFAADLGGATAAWRVVEFHLGPDAVVKDDAQMLHYLQLATERGFVPDDRQAEALSASGALHDPLLHETLGFDLLDVRAAERPSLSALFQLEVNPDAEEADDDGPYLAYLRALSRFETAPGWVFTALAKETLIRKGRWDGEAEAIELLEEAVRRADPEGMQMLARMLVRYRDDPAQLNRSVNILTEAVTGHGLVSAMQDLESLYRCQAPDAPRLSEADYWAENFRATETRPADISIEDTVALDRYTDPWILAQIQTQALMGEPQSLARMMERIQRDPLATIDARRLWAERGQQSDKALELFAIFEFALSPTPAERNLALELFRRVYLNNGVTTALDLSVALVDDDSRDPGNVSELAQLLTTAGNRGEGASIRLLSRLQARDRTQAEVYAEFARVIDERGDFLALMFAIPHVPLETAEDYIDRAVSLMSCGTKDSDELGDAHAILQMPDLSDQWRRIGLTFEGGHVLSKLDLHNRQVASYGKDPAPSILEIYTRALAEGDQAARHGLYALTADPGLVSYDPSAAADHLIAILAGDRPGEKAWALQSYRLAGPEVRSAISARSDLRSLLGEAANRGDGTAALELGLLLLGTSTTGADLAEASRWLQASAESGNVDAMAELGRMLATGLGGPADKEAALGWLERAERAGHLPAGELARLLRVSAAP